jgi:hypothetical protein
MPERVFFGEPTNTPEASPHITAAGDTQGSVRGGGPVEAAAPQRVADPFAPLIGALRDLGGAPMPPPLRLVPKSKPGFKPSSRFIIGLSVTIFWVGFLAGWMARAHG